MPMLASPPLRSTNSCSSANRGHARPSQRGKAPTAAGRPGRTRSSDSIGPNTMTSEEEEEAARAFEEAVTLEKETEGMSPAAEGNVRAEGAKRARVRPIHHEPEDPPGVEAIENLEAQHNQWLIQQQIDVTFTTGSTSNTGGPNAQRRPLGPDNRMPNAASAGRSRSVTPPPEPRRCSSGPLHAAAEGWNARCTGHWWVWRVILVFHDRAHVPPGLVSAASDRGRGGSWSTVSEIRRRRRVGS